MRKDTGLSGVAFMDAEIEKLSLEATEKKWMSYSILSAAVIMPALAVIASTQPLLNRLSQLATGGIYGACAAYMFKAREEIDNRLESLLALNTDLCKSEILNRYAAAKVLGDVTRDANIISELTSKLPLDVAFEYAKKNQLPASYFKQYLQPSVEQPPASIEQSSVRKALPLARPDNGVQDAIIDRKTGAVLAAMAAKYPEYIRTDNAWIDELIESSTRHDMKSRTNHHFGIFASTQGGKSTLAGVLATGIAAQSQAPAKIAIHDAKKIEGLKDLTRWLCGFTYKLDGYKSADKWAELMGKLSYQQMVLASDAGGGNCNGVGELILIQDELNTCYGEGKGLVNQIDSDTVRALVEQWQFAITNLAGSKGHIIFMAQTPLAGQTGLTLPMQNNLCLIMLGNTVSYILEPKNRANYIRNVSNEALDAMLEAAELMQTTGVRYCLVRPTVGNPYIALVPEFDVDSIGVSLNSDVDSTDIDAGGDEPTDYWEDETELSSLTENEPPASTEDEIAQIIELMRGWAREVFTAIGRYPNESEIADAWKKQTGEELTPNGLKYLVDKIIS